ncbi:fatty acid desaturase family protein [Spirillospora sp. CA-294931]|uniref:fatty acid desaturase family protein n=1 Tax=Spirillospora sp. CA-294931 TaxID=3240042 RepID=UPI003D8C2277
MTVTLQDPPERGTASDFGPLAREVRDSGLLDRRIGYYVRAGGLNVVGIVAVWCAVAWASASWWVVLLGVPLAALSARTGFLGHDAGHRQIASSHRVNRLLGMVLGPVMGGLSYGWWNDKHNRHHANPNHVGKDPDVGEGVLSWTVEQAARKQGVLRWLSRHQARLFFPLLLLEGLNLKANSLMDLKNRSPRDRWLEGTLLVTHHAAYLALVFTLVSPGKAVVLIAIHQGLFGVHLGSAFAPNHKGMAMPAEDERLDHLRRQVLTSRNVRGGPVTDWLLGGLNYQIEHHLFPSVPRPSLRKLQPLVKAHCARVGLPYAETGLVDSYRQALRHMHEVGADLRS